MLYQAVFIQLVQYECNCPSISLLLYGNVFISQHAPNMVSMLNTVHSMLDIHHRNTWKTNAEQVLQRSRTRSSKSSLPAPTRLAEHQTEMRITWNLSTLRFVYHDDQTHKLFKWVDENIPAGTFACEFSCYRWFQCEQLRSTVGRYIHLKDWWHCLLRWLHSQSSSWGTAMFEETNMAKNHNTAANSHQSSHPNTTISGCLDSPRLGCRLSFQFSLLGADYSPLDDVKR